MAIPLPRHALRHYLRYAFDSAAQLRRHCRLVDGRVLLFFPEDPPVLAARGRVLIELCFTGSDQQAAVPALVHSRTPGGAWLEMRALSVIAGLQSAVRCARRTQRRLALDQLAWVTHQKGPVLACPVLDLGRGGARLWGIPGDPPAPGESVRVRMQQSPTLNARIAWARGREVGVEFAADSRAAAGATFARLEAQWAEARVARHDRFCLCVAGGDTLGPPWPLHAQQESGS